MSQYHKIQTVWLRDPATKHKTLIPGEWAKPEFHDLRHAEWEFTEKVDGTNIRITWNGTVPTFDGKTDRAQIPSELLNWLNDRFMTVAGRERLSKVLTSDNVVLYGEGYGNKIQKAGPLYGDHQKFVLFDVRVGNQWLRRDLVEGIAQGLGIEVVPVIGAGDLDGMVNLVRSNQLRSAWGDFVPEGIVARPVQGYIMPNGSRVITKLKAKDFRHGREAA